MNDKIGCVYIHENKVNGKVYVGATSQKLNNRFRKNGEGYRNGYARKTRFMEAIEKYGWDNFNHIIVIDGIPMVRARGIEEKLIKFFHATDEKYGYNISEGPGAKGCKVSENAREMRRQRMLGKHPSEETRRLMSEAKRGYTPWNKGKHPGYTEAQLAARIKKAKKVETSDGVFESVTACAKHYGIGRKTLQDWLSGKVAPSKKYAHINARYVSIERR